MKTLAPIALFCYKRLDTLTQTIEALQKNDLAAESELFIFSDGPKKAADEAVIADIRKYLKTVSGFKKTTVIEAPANKGLAKSIISGVTEIVNKYGRIIVLEDDLVTSRNFLVYMNRGLDYYEAKQKVFSVGAFTIPIKGLKKNTVYFTQRADSCGWGTWKDRWSIIDWDVKDYPALMQDSSAQKAFNRMGSDMTGLLTKQRQGKINSWAIRWYASAFLKNKLTLYPSQSLVKNIGQDGSGTHAQIDRSLEEGLPQHPVSLDNIDVEESTEAQKKISEYFFRNMGLKSKLQKILKLGY